MAMCKVVRKSSVRLNGCDTRIPLAPIDCFFYQEKTYLPWQMFFDYYLEAERVAQALERVAEKCPCLCGRLVPDSESRFAIEVKASTRKGNGFPFVEARAEISVAETILKHSRVKDEEAKFPCSPKLPFFMESLDLAAAIRGEGPLVKVKLTHLTDGCVLSVSISHIVLDGERVMELFRDIGRAYCGLEVPSRNHDRSCMWPDRFGKHYPFLGDQVEALPRRCAPKQQSVGYPHSYSQSIETELLYFSKDVLEKLKKQVSPFLVEGEYVSSNDVLLALLWMLRAELVTEKRVKAAADLKIESVKAMVIMECMKAKFSLFTPNYYGNASVGVRLTAKGKELRGKSFGEALALLALKCRNVVTAMREQPELQAEFLLQRYWNLNSPEFRNSNHRPDFALSNLVKTPVSDIDFGKGKPVMAHTALLMPMYGLIDFASPGPRDDAGILFYGQFLRKEVEALKKSVVVKTCAPEMKRLYADFSVADMKSFLGM